MTMSPLAPEAFPTLPTIKNITLAVEEVGFSYKDRPDLLLIMFPENTAVAGVFTQSLCPAAPVEWNKNILPTQKARALLCNAGNANAFTGQAGNQVIELTAQTLAETLAIKKEEVYIASTGVIGEPIDTGMLTNALSKITQKLETEKNQNWYQAAKSICTTDTYPKGASIQTEDGTIVGIAKGSGMIAPDMATMLAFLTTDIPITPNLLQTALAETTDKTFNSITVDSDTSTSDTVLLFSTNQTPSQLIESAEDNRFKNFKTALHTVMLELAHQIVKDGEGAKKFIEITVAGAENNAAAKTIALSIGNSPLVKTALAASDANWGRIIMAIGKAGQKANRDKITIHIGNTLVTRDGAVAPQYDEQEATKHLQQNAVSLTVDVGVGTGQATIWTCDLTHDYVTINASYRS